MNAGREIYEDLHRNNTFATLSSRYEEPETVAKRISFLIGYCSFEPPCVSTIQRAQKLPEKRLGHVMA